MTQWAGHPSAIATGYPDAGVTASQTASGLCLSRGSMASVFPSGVWTFRTEFPNRALAVAFGWPHLTASKGHAPLRRENDQTILIAGQRDHRRDL